MVHGYRKCRFVVIAVVCYHLWECKLLAEFPAHGHADKSFAVYRHEIDIFRGGILGGTDKIALIFPVLIIRDQDDPAFAQAVQGFFNRAEVKHDNNLLCYKSV